MVWGVSHASMQQPPRVRGSGNPSTLHRRRLLFTVGAPSYWLYALKTRTILIQYLQLQHLLALRTPPPHPVPQPRNEQTSLYAFHPRTLTTPTFMSPTYSSCRREMFLGINTDTCFKRTVVKLRFYFLFTKMVGLIFIYLFGIYYTVVKNCWSDFQAVFSK